MAFGTDFMLVSGAVVTGRKAKAATRFWNALSESPEVFEAIIPIALHVAAITKHGIDITRPISDGEISDFAKWLEEMGGMPGCLTCSGKNDSKRLIALGILETEEELKDIEANDKDRLRDLAREMNQKMPSAVELKLRSYGVHPAEVVALMAKENLMRYDEVTESLEIHPENCVPAREVAEAFRKVCAQRRFLVTQAKK